MLIIPRIKRVYFLPIKIKKKKKKIKKVLIGTTSINLENRLYNKTWQNDRRPLETHCFYNDKNTLPQGKIELCLDIIPQQYAGLPGPPLSKWYLDYLLDPPIREEWYLRVNILESKQVLPNKVINIANNSSCWKYLYTLPNHSHLWCYSMMLGNDHIICKTDVHKYAYDGQAIFNCRHIHKILLPAPKPHCTLKLSLWHLQHFFSLNDDCLCEVSIPLWKFCEISRQNYKLKKIKYKNDIYQMNQNSNLNYLLPIQWINLSHPNNSNNKGKLKIQLELIPAECIEKFPGQYLANGDDGNGNYEDSWDINKNAYSYRLINPNLKRFNYSIIPWYRYDLKFIFRIKFIAKKLLPYLIIMFLLFIFFIWLYLSYI